MLEMTLSTLPDLQSGQILVLRTARTPQVAWAINQMAERYPQAKLSVLGTDLGSNALFEGLERYEVDGQWLTPAGVRPFLEAFRARPFDIAVIVLNGDGTAGYERVSRVMKSLPAKTRLVATYDRRWREWHPADFASPSLLFRAACACVEGLLLPFVGLYMLGKSSHPTYMPAGQERRAPGYER